MKLIVFLTTFVIVSATERIIGGKNISITDAPWHVSIHFYGFHCSGSIISNHWIITAAHCIEGSNNFRSVRAGSVFFTHGGSVYNVDLVIKHNGYNINEYGFSNDDIALYHLRDPISFDDTRQPIALFDVDDEVRPTSEARITGWGEINYNTDRLGVLSTSTLPRIPCNNLYSKYGGIYDNQLCLSDLTGWSGACGTDAGGPVVINGRLAGVISWSSCGRPNFPTIFTEVSRYRQWIRHKTGV